MRRVVSRSMPKVKIVTGQGVTLHFGVRMPSQYSDQRIEYDRIGNETGAEPACQIRSKAEPNLMMNDAGIYEIRALDDEHRGKEKRRFINRSEEKPVIENAGPYPH